MIITHNYRHNQVVCWYTKILSPFQQDGINFFSLDELLIHQEYGNLIGSKGQAKINVFDGLFKCISKYDSINQNSKDSMIADMKVFTLFIIIYFKIFLSYFLAISL